MKVINEVVPTDPAQILAAQDVGPDGPVFMINLLKFKEKAEYEDGRETDLTGRQAYQLYGIGVMSILPDFGGRIFFMADLTFLALGQVEELWDEVGIAVYPNRKAMLDMSNSPEWLALADHRDAGLAGQLNIESVMPDRLKMLPWMQLFFEEFD